MLCALQAQIIERVVYMPDEREKQVLFGSAKPPCSRGELEQLDLHGE